MSARITFEQLAREPDETLDLALGAALVAKDVYEELDVDALLSKLAQLAGPLDGGALVGLPLAKQAEAVSERFRELGFHGNSADYYDVRNSLLPDVLERRTGIPITLTLVWCEIARRAGVFARGVAFPGHFVARVDELKALSGRPMAPPLFVDPFHGGRILTDLDARDLSLLQAATSRVTLVRMLNNLKAIWSKRGEHARAAAVIGRMALLVPESAPALRKELEALKHAAKTAPS